MKTQVNSLIERFKYFCATQTASFYAGMVFTVLSLLALTVRLSLVVSAALSPIVTVVLYFTGRLMKQTPKELVHSNEFRDGIIAAVLGCLWVLLFVTI